MQHGIADSVLAHATHVWAQNLYLKHNHVGRWTYILLEELNSLKPGMFSPTFMFKHFYYPLTTFWQFILISQNI